MSPIYGNRCHAIALIMAGAMIAASAAAEAAMAPPLAAGYAVSEMQLAAGGCGPGRHRLLSGGCSVRPSNKTQGDYLRDLRPCQPGTHSESFPNPQGYRCVLNR
jgi:Spy/CpxP family protein refolding chaperone